MSTPEQSRAKFQQVADELRALANLGLHYTDPTSQPYDFERYERVLALAAELLSLTDTRTAEEILRVFSGDLSHTTPLVCADAAVFDSAGRLLLAQRADSGLWCIPGGALAVGETPAEGAMRELREETHVEALATALIGLFDNRFLGGSWPLHAYHLLFACDYVGGEPVPTLESLAVDYFSADNLPPLTPDHRPKVALAFNYHAGRLSGTHFDGR